jgi:hypothetical protein
MIRSSPVESTFICSVAVPTQPAGKLLLFDIKTKKLEVSFMFCAGWVLYVVFVLLGGCCTLCLCCWVGAVRCVCVAGWVLYIVFVLLGGCCTLCLYSISLLNSDAFLSNHKYHNCGSLVVAALVC